MVRYLQIMHIDREEFRPHLRSFPPNLEASSEDEILQKMRWAVAHRDELPDMGAASRAWIIKEQNDMPMETLEEWMEDAS